MSLTSTTIKAAMRNGLPKDRKFVNPCWREDQPGTSFLALRFLMGQKSKYNLHLGLKRLASGGTRAEVHHTFFLTTISAAGNVRYTVASGY